MVSAFCEYSVQFLLGVLGFALNQLVEATVFQFANISISSMLLILWAVAILSVYLQYLARPALCKLLIAYGLGARIPVVIIMFFALRGHWGTHYDRPSGPFRWTNQMMNSTNLSTNIFLQMPLRLVPKRPKYAN